MNTKRIISTILAVFMLLSAFVIVSGAEDDTETTLTYHTSNVKPTMDYLVGAYPIFGEDGVTPETKMIETPADKLAKMDVRLEKNGYRLYVDAYSGEVATYCIKTGETLFSNPYNVGLETSSTAVKNSLLSQIVVHYIDVISGQSYTMNSFDEAAQRGQIIVKNIKNGIRVEYTIGREEARMLLPMLMEREAFENEILYVLRDALGEYSYEYKLVYYGYTLMDPDTRTGSALDKMYKDFPITRKMDVYAFNTGYNKAKRTIIEDLIKTHCPEFSYDDLEAAHLKTEYQSDDTAPPLFKMALEYTLDEYGMSVRLPANGIRFNESLYQLYSLEILPYMGAGQNPNSGYTFFPDGSGTLFDFEKIAKYGAEKNYTGKYYGQDYAYHEIDIRNQEIIRYPVFGVVEEQEFLVGTDISAPGFVFSPETESEGSETTGDGTTAATTTAAATTADETGTDTGTDTDDGEGAEGETPIDPTATYTRNRGFLAIVEEGDALMEITTYHGGRTNTYNTVKMTVYPRPQDSYNLADSISIGEKDSKWTVVSSRKYTGSYKIRYIMLTDDTVAETAELEDHYECSYMGMANAYRDYLERNEILTPLNSEKVNEDTPLYIEVFGTMMTTERILSIPVETMTPLTTFEDVSTIYGELAEDGVKNINFVLTGFTDGGMTYEKVPYKLKWDSSVEKGMSFEELNAEAKENGYGVYPDFDFVFSENNEWFDGYSTDKHAVKTIDGRYASKKEFSATKQTYISYWELALSPAYFRHFYERLTEEYLEYSPSGIAVSTLGTNLNSDFDEDEPYNREDSKLFTERAFEYFDSKFDSVLTSGGNAFSWKYVDHITDIALDSSRILESSASVPFLGIVLHGYVQIAGEPINMEGNIDYAMLKTIENGANLNFILSYRNTENLKTDMYLSKYYSIRYNFWKDDIIELYNKANEVLKDLQTSVIVDHEFLNDGVTRVPDSDELESDADSAVLAAVENQKALDKAEIEEERVYLLEARRNIINISETLEGSLDTEDRKSIISILEKFKELSDMDYDEDALKDVYTLYTRLEEAITGLEDDKIQIVVEKEATEGLKKIRDDALTAITGDGGKKPIYDDACDALEKAASDAGKKDFYNKDSKYYAFKKALDAYCNPLKKGELKIAESKLEDYNNAKAEFEADAAEQSDAIKQAVEAMLKAAEEYKAAYLEYGKAYADVTTNANNIKSLETSIQNTPATIEKYKTTLIPTAINNAKKFLLETVYVEAASTITQIDTIVNGYKKALEDLARFEAEGIYADSIPELKALLDEAKAEYDVVATFRAEVEEYVNGDFDAFNECMGKLPEGVVYEDTKIDAFDYDKIIAAGKEEEPEEEEISVDEKYEVSQNKVVYEVYSNGTAFIMNFNNYGVLVELNGVRYKLEAYGYVVLNDVNV